MTDGTQPFVGDGSPGNRFGVDWGSCAKCGRNAGVLVDGEWRCQSCRRADPSAGTVERSPSRGRYEHAPFEPGNAVGQQFEPGNGAAVKHGARSPRRWRPVASTLASEAVEVAPWLRRRVFASAVAAWARSEAQLHLVGNWLDDNGVVDDDGNPRPATNLAVQLERQAERLRAKLGLDPASLSTILARLASLTTHERAAAVGADVDDLIGQLVAEGRAALAAQRLPEEDHDD